MREDQAQGDVLSRRDEMLLAVLDCFSEHAFLTLDATGTITSWSAGAEQLLACPRDNAVGRHYSTIPTAASVIKPEDLEQAERDGSVWNNRWLTLDGGYRRCAKVTVGSLRQDRALTGYALLIHEVPIPIDSEGSDQREHAAITQRFEQRLSESHALLATEMADRTHAEAARIRLLRRLVMAQEEERRRIARDLHDDLGQRLTALRLTLEGIADPDGRLAGSRATAVEMVRRIEQGLDFLAWELRPAALDELGVTKVLDKYVLEWSRHAGIRATFHAGMRETERFAPELEATLYRIAQEALNNVAKHAHARSVNVLLELRGDALVLVVEDDGRGFRPSAPDVTMIGLAGMRERAAAVGGTLEIEPTPGGGTTVLTRIPLAAGGRERGGPPALARATASRLAPLTTAAGDVVLNAVRQRVQELQNAVAARDEFIATVAHELRNPIAPLTFQLRLAIEKAEQTAAAGAPVPADWVQSQLRRVEQRLHRLLETLDRLLDVSRLSTGLIDLQPEPTDLAAAVREVVSTLEAELAVARCTVTISERGTARGMWDRLRIEQICRNLMSNAIRFGAGRPIEVDIGADADVAILQVRDYGVGIEPEQQARIFERFERGLEQRSGGFGIGLWVVKNICLAMGGSITVESAVGEGARFTVTLPRRMERELDAGAPEES